MLIIITFSPVWWIKMFLHYRNCRRGKKGSYTARTSLSTKSIKQCFIILFQPLTVRNTEFVREVLDTNRNDQNVLIKAWIYPSISECATIVINSRHRVIDNKIFIYRIGRLGSVRFIYRCWLTVVEIHIILIGLCYHRLIILIKPLRMRRLSL